MSDASAVANPFSPTPFLPLVAGLDRLTERLVVDLVKQYPLIFGPWRERFDAEVAVFSKLSRAVADIIHRSPHTAFRKKSRRIIKAFHKSEVSANSASASSLHIFSADMAAQRLSPANDMEDVHLGVFDTVEYCSALSRALERVYKTTSKSLRYKGLHSVSLGGGPGETADCEFVLWECLDDCPMAQNVHENMLLGIGLDARVPAELWLDEDAETVGGSQTDSDLLYDDNSSLVNNIDIRVSDKAGFLPYTPLEDSDDMWGSSQSTTLDDPMLRWADNSFSDPSRATYATGLEVPFSDSHPRPDVPTFSWDTTIIDDEDDDDGWLDGASHSQDQAKPKSGHETETIVPSFQWPAVFLPSEPMYDLEHHPHSSTRLSGAGLPTSGHTLSETTISTHMKQAALDLLLRLTLNPPSRRPPHRRSTICPTVPWSSDGKVHFPVLPHSRAPRLEFTGFRNSRLDVPEGMRRLSGQQVRGGQSMN